MDLPPSPDGGFYGFAPTDGALRWPWVAWLLASCGEPPPPTEHPQLGLDDSDLLSPRQGGSGDPAPEADSKGEL